MAEAALKRARDVEDEADTDERESKQRRLDSPQPPPSLDEMLMFAFNSHTHQMLATLQMEIQGAKTFMANEMAALKSLDAVVHDTLAELEIDDEIIARDLALNKVDRKMADGLCSTTVALYHSKQPTEEDLKEEDFKVFWGSRLIFGMAIPVKQDTTLLDAGAGMINEDGTIVRKKGKSISTKRRGNFPQPVVKKLKQWMLDNLDNPFPSEADRQALAKDCDISVPQVSAWFTNTRRRLLRKTTNGQWEFIEEKKNELDANPLDFMQNPVRPRKKVNSARILSAEVADSEEESDLTPEPMEPIPKKAKSTRSKPKKMEPAGEDEVMEAQILEGSEGEVLSDFFGDDSEEDEKGNYKKRHGDDSEKDSDEEERAPPEDDGGEFVV